MNDPTFFEWKKVNDIIWPHIKDTDEWKLKGYEGLNPITHELYGFRVVRNNKSNIEFIFSKDEDYVYFKLKWM